MAVLGTFGAETRDLTRFATSTGTISVNTVIKNTGDASLRSNPSSSMGFVILSADYKPYRVSFYLYIASTPDTDAEIADNIADCDAGVITLRLTTSNEIDLYTASTKRKDGATQLNTEQWYRISCSASPTSDNVLYYIDGIQESSTYAAANVGLATAGPTFGLSTSCSGDIYIDDIVVDNTDSEDDLGNIRIIRADPNAAGTYTEYDTVTGSATHYLNVDDWATGLVDDDTTKNIENGGGELTRDIYGHESMTDLGVDGSTINAVTIVERFYDDGGSTYYIYFRDNGSDYSDTNAVGKTWTTVQHLLLTQPNGGGAWTEARFDAFEAGAGMNDGKDHEVSACALMLAYTPAAGGIDYPISCTASLTAAATIARALAWDRTIDSGIDASVTIARALTFTRATTANLTAAVSIIASTITEYLITVVANLTVSTTINRLFNRTITTASGLTAAVSIARLVGWTITTSPALAVSTTIARALTFTRSITSNLTASTTISRTLTFARTVSANLTAAISIVKVLGHVITTSANLTVSTTIAKALAFQRAISANVTTAATIVRTMTYDRAISAALTVAVTIRRAGQSLKVVVVSTQYRAIRSITSMYRKLILRI